MSDTNGLTPKTPKKSTTIVLMDGNKILGPPDAFEAFMNWQQSLMNKASAGAALYLAAKSDVAQEVFNEAFWAGIYFATFHRDKVKVTEVEVKDEDEEREEPGSETNRYVS